MDAAPPIPHTWQEFISYAVVACIASGATLVSTWLKRKQPQADVEKTQAETRSLDMATNLQAGNMVLQSLQEATKALVRAERMTAECEHWKQKAGQWEARALLLEEQMDKRVSIGRGKSMETDSIDDS